MANFTDFDGDTLIAAGDYLVGYAAAAGAGDERRWSGSDLASNVAILNGTTAAEMAYLSGVTSGIQDQLDGKIGNLRTVEANFAAAGSPNVITAAETGKILTNEGATVVNYHTLPTAAAGLFFSFIVEDAAGMRIVAATGDTIRVGASVSAAAGYLESTTAGDHVTLVAVNAVEWVAISASTAGWALDGVAIGGGGSGAFTADANTQITPSTAIVLGQATGNEAALSLDYTTNKATSGDDTGLLINLTDTNSPGTSKLMDLQVGGASKFSVNTTGNIHIDPSNASAYSQYAVGAYTAWSFYGGSGFGTTQALRVIAPGGLLVSGTYPNLRLGADLLLTRAAAATLQLGFDHATTPTGQTIKAHDVVTGTGADLTLSGGSGDVANGDVVIEAGASTLTVQATADSSAILDSAGALFIKKAGTIQFLFGGGSGNASYRPLYPVGTYDLGLTTRRWATTYTQALDIDQGTLTDDAQALNITSTWNDAADTFTLIKADVTDTASAAGSKLMDLQVGGSSKFSVDALGAVNAGAQAFGVTALNISPGHVTGLGSHSPSFVTTFCQGADILSVNSVGMRLRAAMTLGWSATADSTGTSDLLLTRDSAATLQLGEDHATVATGQTIKAHDVVTGTGADLTLSGGSGDVANGDIILSGNVHASQITGTENNFVGEGAGLSNSGSYSSGFGFDSLSSNTGVHNTGFGWSSLKNNTGTYNTASGSFALLNNTGNNNAANGMQALQGNTGSSNTASGYRAGLYQSGTTTPLTTASNSVLLGALTKGIQGATNQIVIGDTAESIGANSVVLGNDSIVTTALKGSVGIGTTTPATTLDVVGSIAATGTVKTTPTTVGALPAAATAGAGARTFVTDSANSLSSHHGQTVSGGGANFSPVYSDGTNWLVG